MIRTQIKIGQLKLEIEQSSHVFFKDNFGKDIYKDWDDLSGKAKNEIKKTIIRAEYLIRTSAESLWE
jgi:hypothetical protein